MIRGTSWEKFLTPTEKKIRTYEVDRSRVFNENRVSEYLKLNEFPEEPVLEAYTLC